MKIFPSLKNVLLSIIPKFISTKVYLFRRRKYYGQRFIDFDIKKYLNFEKGFFIEMGAMDGITYSNTFHLEKYKNWTGILVEPSKSQFEFCKLNRPSSKVFNCLCSSFENSDKEFLFYEMGAMSYSKFQNTDNDYLSHHENAKKILGNYSEIENSYYVKTKTVTELLDSVDSPEIINFFSLDVEGSELEVLNGFDFNKYKIQYLLIETRNYERTNKYLIDLGFKYIDSIDKNNLLYSHEFFN
tara:strand:- start:308 stop:1033 length:726 start_codon:yes stop_codon:yes gene_type:complete